MSLRVFTSGQNCHRSPWLPGEDSFAGFALELEMEGSVPLGKSLVLCVTSEWENSTCFVGLTKLQGSKEIQLKGKHFWKGTAQCRWSDFVHLSRNSAFSS